MTTATVRDHEQGERRWFCGGGMHTWLATSDETGGSFLLFEDQVEAGKVTPLHLHADADETFYVLDGQIDVFIDGTLHSLSAGGIAVVPRGIPHAFRAGAGTARVLCLQTPGSGEAFYKMASEPALDGADPTPVDFARVQAAAAATGAIEILGPPPF